MAEPDLKRQVLQSVIDKLCITEFAASDILVNDDAKQMNEAKSESRKARLISGKTLRVGGKEIERGQIMTKFRFGKNKKLVADLRFNYAGQEQKIIEKVLDPLKNVIRKLVICGNFEFSDELLGWISTRYPTLRTLKIYLDEELLNCVTCEGIANSVARLNLHCLHLTQCRLLDSVVINSPSLRKLTLIGIPEVDRVQLNCSKLERIVLDVGKFKNCNWLAQSLAQCSNSLKWLNLSCNLFPHELNSLNLSSFSNLEGFCGQLQDLTHQHWSYFPRSLKTLDVTAPTLDDTSLQVMAMYFSSLERMILRNVKVSSNAIGYTLGLLNLTGLYLHDEYIRELEVSSETLLSIEVENCLSLNSLRVNGSNLVTINVRNCPNLDAKKFEIVGSDLKLSEVLNL